MLMRDLLNLFENKIIKQEKINKTTFFIEMHYPIRVGNVDASRFKLIFNFDHWEIHGLPEGKTHFKLIKGGFDSRQEAIDYLKSF